MAIKYFAFRNNHSGVVFRKTFDKFIINQTRHEAKKKKYNKDANHEHLKE